MIGGFLLAMFGGVLVANAAIDVKNHDNHEAAKRRAEDAFNNNGITGSCIVTARYNDGTLCNSCDINGIVFPAYGTFNEALKHPLKVYGGSDATTINFQITVTSEKGDRKTYDVCKKSDTPFFTSQDNEAIIAVIFE